MIFFKRVVINKTDKTAVILTYPGIGDIVWHLPFLHGLAKVSKDKKFPRDVSTVAVDEIGQEHW